MIIIKQTNIIQIIFLSIIVILFVFFFIIPTKTLHANLSDLNLEQDQKLFILNNVKQDGKTGLLSIRSSDGSPFFLPGNWEVQFSKNHVYAFSKQELNILTDTSINTINLSDKNADIISIETNILETQLAIVSKKETSSRICILPLIQASQSDCHTVDINKLSEVRFDPYDDDVLLIKTNDGQLYTYTISEAKMHAVAVDKDIEKLKTLNKLFENSYTPPKSNLLFLNLLFNNSENDSKVFQVSLNTISAIQLDDKHILLKEKNAFRIFETDTKLLATLAETSNFDQAYLLIPYGSEVFSF